MASIRPPDGTRIQTQSFAASEVEHQKPQPLSAQCCRPDTHGVRPTTSLDIEQCLLPCAMVGSMECDWCAVHSWNLKLTNIQVGKSVSIWEPRTMYAATQPALQLQQERIQVVCSNKVVGLPRTAPSMVCVALFLLNRYWEIVTVKGVIP